MIRIFSTFSPKKCTFIEIDVVKIKNVSTASLMKGEELLNKDRAVHLCQEMVQLQAESCSGKWFVLSVGQYRAYHGYSCINV